MQLVKTCCKPAGDAALPQQPSLHGRIAVLKLKYEQEHVNVYIVKLCNLKHAAGGHVISLRFQKFGVSSAPSQQLADQSSHSRQYTLSPAHFQPQILQPIASHVQNHYHWSLPTVAPIRASTITRLVTIIVDK